MNTRNRKYQLNETYFSSIDSESKAYLLGFLFADGCIRHHTLIVNLSAKDISVVKLLKKELASEHPIRIFRRKTNKTQTAREYCSFEVTSQTLISDLTKLGCTPRKSLSLRFPVNLIPPIFVHHFMRGYFDGDGWISGGTFGLISTEAFLTEFRKVLQDRCCLNAVQIKRYRCKNPRLTYCGTANLNKIFDFLYENATVFLHRKKAKFPLTRSLGRGKHFAKRYVVTFEDGTKETVNNLRQWCFQRSLRPGSFFSVLNGAWTSYRGMTIEYSET